MSLHESKSSKTNQKNTPETTESIHKDAPKNAGNRLRAQFEAHGLTRDAIQRAHGLKGNSKSVEQQAEGGLQGSGEALPYLETIQKAFGKYNIQASRAHLGAATQRAAKSLGVKGYASQNQVGFAKKPDLHTTAHEAAHLIHQHYGVTNTKGPSNDAYEHNADAVADAVVSGQSAEGLLDAMVSNQDPSEVAIEGASGDVVQMKQGLENDFERLGDWLDQAALSGSDTSQNLFSDLIDACLAYEDSKDTRPNSLLELAQETMTRFRAWYSHILSESENLDECIATHEHCSTLMEILGEHIDRQGRSVERIDRITADDHAPYQQMTDEGILWSMNENAYNTQQLGQEGRAYFETLSAMNVQDTQKQLKPVYNRWPFHSSKDLPSDKVTAFLDRAQAEIANAHFNHYTPVDRARMMCENGGMRAKSMLTRDLASFKDNSEDFDSHGLANTGFVFGYIEHADAPLRDSRFAKESGGKDPTEEDGPKCRISIPIQESGLLDTGWVMLNDFAQREYPTLKTKEPSEESPQPWRSELRTRSGPESEGATMRTYNEGDRNVDLEDSMEQQKEREQQIPNDQKASFGFLYNYTTQAESNHLAYEGKDAKNPLICPEKLYHNVLVGGDIVEGLALRAALEINRIHSVNREMGLRMIDLEGAALLKLICKDFFRPQAMIPRGLEFDEKYIQSDD